MLHKETKIVTNIKTTGFFVQEFAGHEMLADFVITNTCAKGFVENGKRLFRFKPNSILVFHYFDLFEE